MINPVKLLGMLMFSSVFVFFGYELYTQQAVKVDAERRLTTLWNLAMQQYPVLGDYNVHFTQHVKMVLEVLGYLLMSAPIMICCRWWAMFQMPAWALWCAMFFNPWVAFKDATGKDEALTAQVTCLKNLAIFGGLLWRLSESSTTSTKTVSRKAKAGKN